LRWIGTTKTSQSRRPGLTAKRRRASVVKGAILEGGEGCEPGASIAQVGARKEATVAQSVAQHDCGSPNGEPQTALRCDGEGGIRTRDTTIFSRVLYQLSYLAWETQGWALQGEG
jgi:hypothetical protein